MREMLVSFVLPRDNRSGGIRVSVKMANMLLLRGHSARILFRKWPLVSANGLRDLLEGSRLLFVPKDKRGWFHFFNGRVDGFLDLNEVAFSPGEVVIAVGSYNIWQVDGLNAPVKKLRYNHGFPTEFSAELKAAWELKMPTITVSRTLVPRLESMSGEKVLAVIPNGVDLTDYFPMPGMARDGVGIIYSSHPNKAPGKIIELVDEVNRHFPGMPVYVFSTERRPPKLGVCEYHRFPSIDEARVIYNRCFAWLLTSNTEGLPGPVLEAMACGTPVISTANEGSAEIIDSGVDGILVPIGDIRGMIEGIGRLREDASLLDRFSKAALSRAQEYSWERAADKMERLLASL